MTRPQFRSRLSAWCLLNQEGAHQHDALQDCQACRADSGATLLPPPQRHGHRAHHQARQHSDQQQAQPRRGPIHQGRGERRRGGRQPEHICQVTQAAAPVGLRTFSEPTESRRPSQPGSTYPTVSHRTRSPVQPQRQTQPNWSASKSRHPRTSRAIQPASRLDPSLHNQSTNPIKASRFSSMNITALGPVSPPRTSMRGVYDRTRRSRAANEHREGRP